MAPRLALAVAAACLVACATAATPGNPAQAIPEPVPARNDDRVVLLDAGPDGATIIVESIRCYILERVAFAAGISHITSESDRIVAAWARILNEARLPRVSGRG